MGMSGRKLQIQLGPVVIRTRQEFPLTLGQNLFTDLQMNCDRNAPKMGTAMALTQLIYTVGISQESSLSKLKSQTNAVIKTCEEMGITGRNFNIDYESFSIKEGPTPVIKAYYEAVLKDPWIVYDVFHEENAIEERAFDDFSIWVRSTSGFTLGPNINVLSPDSMRQALPTNLSPRLKIIMQSHLPPELFEQV